jgi:hypothetical protein
MEFREPQALMDTHQNRSVRHANGEQPDFTWSLQRPRQRLDRYLNHAAADSVHRGAQNAPKSSIRTLGRRNNRNRPEGNAVASVV